MLHLVLDTEALLRDPARQGEAFARINELARADILRIHVALFSKREFISHLEDEIDAAEKSISSTVAKLRRKIWLGYSPGVDAKYASALTELVSSLKEGLDHDWDVWEEYCHVSVHDNEPADLRPVQDSYFQGSDGFEYKKCREDFPDAFIVRVIAKLSPMLEPLHVVSHDRNFRGACSLLGGVVAHAELSSFLASEAVQQVCVSEVGRLNVGATRGLLHRYNAYERELHALLLRHFAANPFSSSTLPSADRSGRVAEIANDFGVECQGENATYVSSHLISVPFRWQVLADVAFELGRDEWESLDAALSNRIRVLSWGDDLLQLEQTFDLSVFGTALLRVTVDLDSSLLETAALVDAVTNATAVIGSIHDVTLDAPRSNWPR